MCPPTRGTKVMLADHISPPSLSSPNALLKFRSFLQAACTDFKKLDLAYAPPQVCSSYLPLRPFASLLVPHSHEATATAATSRGASCQGETPAPVHSPGCACRGSCSLGGCGRGQATLSEGWRKPHPQGRFQPMRGGRREGD